MSLKLAQNKVLEGNSRKMRGAKNLIKNSNSDMAAIFGVSVNMYFLPLHIPPCIDTKMRTNLSNGGDNGDAVARWKKKRRDKKRDSDGGLSGSAAKKNKKVNQEN